MSDEEDFNLPKSITSALGLSPIEVVIPPAVIPETPAGDYEQARKNIYETLNKMNHAFDNMIHLSQDAAHPRSFEVLNEMGRTIIEKNVELLDLAKKQQDLLKGAENSPSTINNTLVLTSQELFEKIKGHIKKPE